MKTVLTFLLFVVIPLPLLPQGSPPGAEDTVRQALRNAETGVYTSSEQKSLERLGDASALALVRIIGGKPLQDGDIDPILLIIRLSYGSPRIVADESSREPRATSLLLRYLSLSATDPLVKEKIAAAGAYVAQQCREAKVRHEKP